MARLGMRVAAETIDEWARQIDRPVIVAEFSAQQQQAETQGDEPRENTRVSPAFYIEQKSGFHLEQNRREP